MEISSMIEAFRSLALTEFSVTLPALIVSLIIALVFGIFQAATQIQEQSLSFFFKLIAMAIMFYIFGDWMLTVLIEGFKEYIDKIPDLIK